MKTTDLVNETLNRVRVNSDADAEIKNSSHTGKKTTLPPHLQGLGIDQNAAQKARDRMQQTDNNLSSVPAFRKP